MFLDKVNVEDALISANIAVLQDLAAKYNLFKSFLGLPYLLRYFNRHQQVAVSHQSNEAKSLSLPLTHNEAVAVKNGYVVLYKYLIF